MTNPYQAPSDAPLPEVVSARLTEPGERPTLVRYRVIALTCAMSVLLYLDRFCIGPVTETIIGELKLDRAWFGWAIGFFFYAYALLQVPTGWICDRFGSRVALPLYVIGWSLATILLGMANSVVAFLALRLLLGAAQAGAYPAAAGYIKKWIPLGGRARANSVVTMGGRAGGMLAFAITPLLMVWVGRQLGWETGQWRVVFLLYGTLGLVWAVIFWWQFRERPDDHPACNSSEVALVEPSAATARPVSPVALMLRLMLHRNVVLLSIAGIFVNWGWIFLVSWMPSYLKDAYSGQMAETAAAVAEWLNALRTSFGFEPMKTTGLEPHALLAGPLTALTGIAGICGCMTGGFAADFLLRHLGPVWGRRVPGIAAATIAACAYGASLFARDIWVFVGLMAAASFFIDVGLGALWATYQDFGGRYVASVLGFANMCGNLAAGLAGVIYGYLAKYHWWSGVFTIAGASLLLMAVCWLFVDPTRKFVVGQDDG